MGDLFFIIRMSIYTLFIVFFMQVKIGSQTVEDRVVDFTHRSEFSNVIQDVAQGAVTFLGIQYNKIAGQINTSFTRQHSSSQVPGKRLVNKMNEIKSSFKEKISEEVGGVKESVKKDLNSHESIEN